jgi:dTDP-4-dehydrorhamnose reductase
MRLMVTGAAGLLGANIVSAATGRGHAVTAVLHRVRAEFPGADHVHVDLLEHDSVGAAVRSIAPDWIIHCAAITDLDWCEQHPSDAVRAHVDATANLALASAGAGCAFLYVSTDSVFDGTRGAYTEEDAPHPINTYSRTKLEGENAASSATTRCLVVRMCLYGWNLQSKQSLGEWLLERLERGEPVPGFDDVHFNPLVASDLAEVLLDLAGAGATGLFHAGGGEACTKFQFAQALARTFGHDPAAVTRSSVSSARFVAPRPLNTSMNVSKLARTLGRPLPSTQRGLERFLETRENGYRARLKSCFRA